MGISVLIAPQTIVDLPMAMTLGLVFGMGPCLVSCLPYLAPVFLASEGGVRQSWRILLPLSLGRLTAYSVFGLLCGLAGQRVGDQIGGDSVRIVVGSAAVMMGLAMLLGRWPGKSCTPAAPSTGSSTFPLRRIDGVTRRHGLMPGGLYLMGVGMALTPCAPLGVVMLSAAATASAGRGLTLGLGFGLGAVAVPTIVYGIGVAYFGSRLREQLGHWRPRLENLSAGLLILVGLSNLAR
jgi:sulfite exporter TauE/SafE